MALYPTAGSSMLSMYGTPQQPNQIIQGSGYSSAYASNPTNYSRPQVLGATTGTYLSPGGAPNSTPDIPVYLAPGGSPSSSPDLSNPVKQREYAQGQGFGSYEDYLRSQQVQAPSNNGMLDAIRARLDEARNTARGLISRAGEERDYLTGQIKDQYGQLRTRAGDRLNTSLETLGQEGTKLTNIYERSKGDTRRRSANAETDNRNRARALNRLDSSFYDDIQAENTADLTRGLGVLDVEEADKQAALGTRKTEANQYFNEILQDIDTQQTQAERQAQVEYQNAVAQGEALERAGVLDYGEGVQQAEAAYQSRLDQISQAAQNLALQKLSLASQVAAGGQSVNSFNAINDSLSSTLGNNTGINSVMAADPNLLTMAPVQTPAQQFYGQQVRKPVDPYAQYIG